VPRLFLISLLLSSAAFAADGQLDRATLKGLKAVSIVIDPVNDELRGQGIDPDFLRVSLQTRLEKAGIAIDKNAVEFLGLRVTAAIGKRMPVALSLSLGLYQGVTLTRDRDIRTATETWSVDSIASAQPKAVKEASFDLVNDLADRFIAAYRSANPR
jgi:hypothetical protein